MSVLSSVMNWGEVKTDPHKYLRHVNWGVENFTGVEPSNPR
jgi:hypothetical protein